MNFLSLYIFIFINLAIVAYYDVKTRKIKNVWSLLNLSFGLAFLILNKDQYHFGLDHFVFPLGFLTITFLLFWMKIMGGGDSKYLTTFFFLIPTKMHEDFLFYLIAITALVGLVFLAVNVFKQRHVVVQEIFMGKFKSIYFKLGTKIPYAPVALMAWGWLGIEQLKNGNF